MQTIQIDKAQLVKEIKSIYQEAKNYPDLVKKLIDIGIQSYTVDVSSGIILYRLAEGVTCEHEPNHVIELRKIEQQHDIDRTIQAIRNNQQGKTNYPTFMKEIAGAGVRFYEATLTGNNKRVTYIGVGSIYEEAIPI